MAWTVNRQWRLLASTAAAIECAATVCSPDTQPALAPGFPMAFPWGCFLADGAFKSVREGYPRDTSAEGTSSRRAT